MKKIMTIVLCIVCGHTNMARAADVQVFQPDTMTVNVVNKNAPTIVNQNKPTINIVGKDDPFNASNPAELKFRMQCLSQEQLQEKLATIDTHQLKLFLNTLQVVELQNLRKLLGKQGESYIITKRGDRVFLTLIEDAIAQEKKREEDRLVLERRDEEWKKKGKVGFMGIFVMCIATIVGGTIYG